MRPARPTTVLAAMATAAVAFTATLCAVFAFPVAAQAMTLTVTSLVSGPTVVGSGKEVAVVRTVGAFSALRLEWPLDVEAHPGPHPGVTLHADDNLEPLIETLVEGDTLVLRLRKGVSLRTRHKLVADVEFATLARTAQHGSGDLHIAAFSAASLQSSIAGSGDLSLTDARLGRFAVEVAGSGDVTATGHADEARYSVAGSGDIHANGLAARRVEVDIQGSGDADVNATEALRARVAGSGDVSYTGHPHAIDRKVSGSGSVEAEDL